MTSDLPQFTGPAQVRQRLRLATAIGLLAGAAVLIGGAASLSTSRTPEAKREPVSPTPSSTSELPQLLNPATLVEARIEAAEHATSRAEAAIQHARQLGVVDELELEAFEQRLGSGQAPRSRVDESDPPSRPLHAVSKPIDPEPRAL